MDGTERNILVYVEDISRLVGAVDLSLSYYGYAIYLALSLEEVCETLRRLPVDRVITDLSCLSLDRCSLLRRVEQLAPAATVMILTDGDEPQGPDGETRSLPGFFLVGPGFMNTAQVQ